MTLHPSRTEDNRAFIAISSLAFALLLVLVLSTPFVEMSGVLSERQKAYRLCGYGLAGLLQIALIVMRGWQRSLRIVSTPASLFFVWCFLSLAWTQHFELTGKRLALLSLVYGGTFAGVIDLSTQRSFGIIRAVLVFALILNFVTATIFPDIGTHAFDDLNLWRGVMAHKNIAGMLCAITVILFVFDEGKIRVAARAASIVAASLFFYLAWSKTALVSLPVALAAGGLVAIGSPRFSPDGWSKPASMGSLGLYGIALLTLIVATLQRDIFLSLTDNTANLTGRAAIWRPMIQFYLEHPLLGSGYGAYWDASADLIDMQAQNASVWKNIDQGHNGYLDLLVQVGFPGLALAAYAAFVWPVSRIVDMAGRNPQRAALLVALLVFLLIENFSESSLFADDTLGNAFLFIAIAYVHRSALRSLKRSRARETDGRPSAAQLREIRQKQRQSMGEG